MKNLPNHPEDNNSKSNKTNINKTNHTKRTANTFKFSRLISEFIVFGFIYISGYAVAQLFPPEPTECVPLMAQATNNMTNMPSNNTSIEKALL